MQGLKTLKLIANVILLSIITFAIGLVMWLWEMITNVELHATLVIGASVGVIIIGFVSLYEISMSINRKNRQDGK